LVAGVVGTQKKALALMVLGTASHAGKSLIATALCRIFARRGVRVAPFKAQNMSLNSAATPDGLEVGRAQALQAEAAGLAPRADMNPVLLKPMSTTGSQAIVNGRIYGTLTSRDFLGGAKDALWPRVVAAYDRLAEEFELIVIEGAGSPAEINLRATDIVNMAVAHYADARCLLVADIDRGGAFAAIAGTFALLDAADRACITAYAFNKFRGDASLLDKGIVALDALVGAPCAGIIPYIDTTGLDEEDGVAIERVRERGWGPDGDCLRVAVITLPHLANFTDFDALQEEPSVDLVYTRVPATLERADVVFLPGTKDTIGDLDWLHECGLDRAVMAVAARGAIVFGICGGMQMLGTTIDDPSNVERGGSRAGLALLDLRSTFASAKTTVPVTGRTDAFGEQLELDGYEIHVGETEYAARARPFAQISHNGVARRDGAIANGGRISGTYLHGLFAKDAVRHAFVAWARALCGHGRARTLAPVQVRRNERLDTLADAVEVALDLTRLLP
jgi:adenosylcobyric acid synthase